MTTYRTDKTSRVILSLFVAYAAAYGFARNKTLRAVGSIESGQQRLYIIKDDHTPGEGWEYKLFWPAIKLEETVRNLKHDF
ncbi:MAG: hypothetical protein AAFQ74_03570 [Cyanobacteria bacterium J06623_4]